MMKKKFEGIPLYILGHSMGSLVTRAVLAKHSFRPVPCGDIAYQIHQIGIGSCGKAEIAPRVFFISFGL